MAAQETATPARPSFMAQLLWLLLGMLVIATFGSMLYFMWRPVVTGQQQVAPDQAMPTAIIRPIAPPASAPLAPPRSDPAPIVAPAIPGIAQNEATAQAEYDAAVHAAEMQAAPAPIPNTGQSAPVIINERPADERMPAGENVPTAAPIQPAESGGIFGSKPVLVNPQETHQCKHGQVWIDGKGCKNP